MKRVSLMSLLAVIVADGFFLYQFSQLDLTSVTWILAFGGFWILFHLIDLLHLFNHMCDFFTDQYSRIWSKLALMAGLLVFSDLTFLGLLFLIPHWQLLFGTVLCHALLYLGLMKKLHQDFPMEFSKKVSYFDLL